MISITTFRGISDHNAIRNVGTDRIVLAGETRRTKSATLSFSRPWNALIRRGIIGVYHNVSREYLHQYLWHFDFVWNRRKLNDGERTVLAIQAAEGKRLMYKSEVAPDA